jgi:4-amino-4-deoxy-L-arabinose transferase-like glycosyltransferase
MKNWAYDRLRTLFQGRELTAGRQTTLCYIALGVPFLVVIIAFAGLTKTFPTFHGSDELIYHYPIIIKFAREYPHIDFINYISATTPLFHIAFMFAGKLMGFELYKLRILNALISYIAVIVLFRLLVFRLNMPVLKALIFSLVFSLSPYFFGASFILLTDNLGILFCLLAVNCFYRFRENTSLKYSLLTCLFIAAALLTRQTFAWLALSFLIYLMIVQMTLASRIAALAALVIAIMPLLSFMILWGGLLPPALQQKHVTDTLLNLKPVEFMVALIGLYSLFLRIDSFVALMRDFNCLHWTALVVGILLILLYPISWQPGDDGYLWRISSYLPTFGSTGVLFWALVPTGMVATAHQVPCKLDEALPVIFLVTFLIVMMSSKLVFQKYFDPFALLFIFLLSGQQGSQTGRQTYQAPLEYAGSLMLIIGFVVYPFISYILFYP